MSEPNALALELGLVFVGSASFTVIFREQRRCVVVRVDSDGNASSLVSVQSRPLTAPTRPTVVIRSRSGASSPDPGSPNLCFDVAAAIHRHVVLNGMSMRWMLDGDPGHSRPPSPPILPTDGETEGTDR
jgi:hypothetical protein